MKSKYLSLCVGTVFAVLVLVAVDAYSCTRVFWKRRLKVFRWRRIRSQEVKTFDIYRAQLDSIGISILGTRMNTDYQDNKSYKKPNLCGHL